MKCTWNIVKTTQFLLIEGALEALFFKVIIMDVNFFVGYCTFARFGNGNDLLYNKLYIKNKCFTIRIWPGTVERKLSGHQKT